MKIDHFAGGSGYAVVVSDSPKPRSKTINAFGVVRTFSHTVEKTSGPWAYEHHFNRDDRDDWRHA